MIPASKPVIVTVDARPVIVTTPLTSVTLIESLPAVPLMTTVSATPSPVPLPGVVDRSIATCFTLVLDRSSTVIVSAPPNGLTSMFSMFVRFIVMPPRSRVRVAPLPFAEISKFSLPAAPLNSSVSLPAPPSTVSLPSPLFQTKVSSPAPIDAVSLPLPPMTVSLPALPVMVSLPSPPLIVRLIWPESSRKH